MYRGMFANILDENYCNFTTSSSNKGFLTPNSSKITKKKKRKGAREL